MKNLNKFTLAIAAALITAGTAFADMDVVRVDHTSGPPTFIYRHSERMPTIALYAGGKTFVSESEVVIVPARVSEGYGRVQLGRGQWITVAMAPSE